MDVGKILGIGKLQEMLREVSCQYLWKDFTLNDLDKLEKW